MGLMDSLKITTNNLVGKVGDVVSDTGHSIANTAEMAKRKTQSGLATLSSGLSGGKKTRKIGTPSNLRRADSTSHANGELRPDECSDRRWHATLFERRRSTPFSMDQSDLFCWSQLRKSEWN